MKKSLVLLFVLCTFQLFAQRSGTSWILGPNGEHVGTVDSYTSPVSGTRTTYYDNNGQIVGTVESDRNAGYIPVAHPYQYRSQTGQIGGSNVSTGVITGSGTRALDYSIYISDQEAMNYSPRDEGNYYDPTNDWRHPSYVPPLVFTRDESEESTPYSDNMSLEDNFKWFKENYPEYNFIGPLHGTKIELKTVKMGKRGAPELIILKKKVDLIAKRMRKMGFHHSVIRMTVDYALYRYKFIENK